MISLFKKNQNKTSRYRLLALCAISLLIPGSVFSQSHHDWTYNLGVYEVNIRQYTQSGTINAFTENHLDRLDELGVGILWIMPIHPIGEENRLGSLGSYYSVQDYRAVNPNFGTMEDFKTLVQEAHARDMYVIMDWVPNHTSWDNVLTEEHPEWYVTNSEGEFIPPPGTNWSDVIELDYSKEGLREYMINTLKFWVDSTGVDGFRFDAAGFVPDDFWTQANDSLKAHQSDILLLAEDDGTKWQELGFDMSFGWGLYGFENGVLLDLVEGTASASSLNSYGTLQKIQFDSTHYRMYFTSNHDINSWEGTTAELFGDAAETFAVLTATFHGTPLIYSGQEAGLNKRLSFFDKDQITWRDHPNTELYSTLLDLKRTNKALWNGYKENQFRRVLTSDNEHIFAYTREMEGDRIFVIMNLSDEANTFTFDSEIHIGTYQNVFSEEIESFSSHTEMTLGSWDYRVFQSGGTSPVSIEEEAVDETQPEEIKLNQNYPNPFNPATNISYILPTVGNVTLAVYDLLGQKVETLVNATQSAGNYSLQFSAEQLSSGVYIYRLETDQTIVSKKMILIK